ncbi:MAG: phenylalanine--tRNA ligase subunit beta [Clostridia bacterium]|nr:phenylalanine--tRNA ligase subunit beta [Clostridia bacterium]
MQVSFKWLQEYVDIDITPEELAEKLTNAGVTVDEIEYLNKGIEGVVVAKVLTVQKHPNADKLSLCQVTTDNENVYQVVCGAPNVRDGQIVPFALVGANLPGNVKIKKAKLRGVESQGMICSAQELGIDDESLPSEQREGILVLDPSAPLGEDIVKYLNLDDCILKLDLTPNRGDCLSVINIAREIGAILGKKVKLPEISFAEIDKNVHDFVQIKIDAPDLCYRYAARIIEGVTIKPSPLWLQHRLRCSGIRPINNVVDITNYILLEYGQPLHAFDYNFLEQGQIIVRQAKPGEKIVTLDGQERELTEEMLLITDPTKAVAVAGVMGGENSEVKETTTTVLIESAYFNPKSIRRTSTGLGLRSESSLRFEKGINIETVVEACNRAAQLMADLAGGRILKGVADNYPTPIKRTVIHLQLDKINKVLGTALTDKEIKGILTRLDFLILQEDGEKITVEVPPYRPDITIPEDLIEEVARLYGYENIPVTLPEGVTSQGQKTAEQKLRDKILEVLSFRGLYEVINFSFINKNHFDKLLLPEDDSRRNAIPLLNPLSEEQGYMRTSILPGLLVNLQKNINKRNENIGIFELGKIYLPQSQGQDITREKMTLGIAVSGVLVSDWQEKGRKVDFYYLKGILEDLFDKLNIINVDFVPCKDNPSYHPGRTAKVYVNNEQIGILGQVHPLVLENYDLPKEVYIAEIDVDVLFKIGQGKVEFKQLPKFPSVSRDLAIVVKDQVLAKDLIEKIKELGGELLVELQIFDVYKGGQIPSDSKSIAFSLTFQAMDRTLTDKEINEIFDRIQNSLGVHFGATLRA